MSEEQSIISVDGATKSTLSKIKRQSDAETWSEFFAEIMPESAEAIEGEDGDSLTIDEDELDLPDTTREARAIAIGIFEAVEMTDISDDLAQLIAELRAREMYRSNQKVVDYLLEKAQNGESLHGTDQALMEMVIRTEGGSGADEPADNPLSAIPGGQIGELFSADGDEAAAPDQ